MKAAKEKKLIVAIDGPAGAGKSTISKLVARDMGFLYIDTGAMYRAVTWKALRDKANFHDPEALAEIARNSKIDLKQDKKHNLLHVFIDGEEVTGKIRSERVSRHTKQVASSPGVRKVLRLAQQKLGKRGNVVMEGRDIGTAVFPKAEVKIFLDASPTERAKRRYAELKAKGKRVSLHRIAHAIAQRDYQDRHRSYSPLLQAKDAVVIDSTGLTLEKVALEVLGVIATRRTQLRNARG
jgi:cytidylate kinase